jgi:hypothetical protein
MTTKPEHLGGNKWRVRAYVGRQRFNGTYPRRSISFRADDRATAELKAAELEPLLNEERAALGVAEPSVAIRLTDETVERIANRVAELLR